MRLKQGRDRGDTRQRIIVEVRLLYLAILDGNFETKRGAQSVDRATFQLCFNGIGMHGKTAVDCRDYPLDCQVPFIIDSNLDRVGGITAEREVRGQTDASTVW